MTLNLKAIPLTSKFHVGEAQPPHMPKKPTPAAFKGWGQLALVWGSCALASIGVARGRSLWLEGEGGGKQEVVSWRVECGFGMSIRWERSGHESGVLCQSRGSEIQGQLRQSCWPAGRALKGPGSERNAQLLWLPAHPDSSPFSKPSVKPVLTMQLWGGREPQQGWHRAGAAGLPPDPRQIWGKWGRGPHLSNGSQRW